MKKIQDLNKRFYKILLFLLLLYQSSFSQIKKIWALGDGEKVFRNDQNNPDKNGNFVWDGKTIHLKGLYNEVLAFQVIVETGISGAKAIELSVDAPVEKVSGKIIGENTLRYGPDGTIEIFTEHYLKVIDSTRPNWYYGSALAAPKKMTGWIPDGLIPTDAPRGLGGFPVDISPLDTTAFYSKEVSSQNQGFWIDISLPRSQKNFPAGTYYGKVKVSQQGNLIGEIPLEVTLLPHYLPDENHQNVWVFSGDVYPYFPGLSKKQIDDMIKFEGHRHRVDMGRRICGKSIAF